MTDQAKSGAASAARQAIAAADGPGSGTQAIEQKDFFDRHPGQRGTPAPQNDPRARALGTPVDTGPPEDLQHHRPQSEPGVIDSGTRGYSKFHGADLEMLTTDFLDDSAPAATGRGRKPGSKNKATEDWLEFIRRLHGDPMLALSRVMNMHPTEIAREMGISDVDAFRGWKDIVLGLMPYFHRKQPIAIEADDGGQVIVVGVSRALATKIMASGQGDNVLEADFVDVEREPPPAADDD